VRYVLFLFFFLIGFFANAQSSVTRKHAHHDSVKFAAPKIKPEDTIDMPPPVEHNYPGKADSTKQGDENVPDDLNVAPLMMEPEEMAQFPGGLDSLSRYIRMHLKYPEMAKEEGIEGRVFISFQIDTTGSIVDVRVVKSANPMLGKEAIRCIENMPKWTPAKENHVKVRSQYNLPIHFSIQ
jgi:TonB family protein